MHSSRLELILPNIMRQSSSPAIREYYQTAETPLMALERQLDAFPASLLPGNTSYFDFLFWALGAEDLNWAEYSVTKKRAVLKRLFQLHRAKGTTEGYAIALQLLVDKALIKVSSPPSKAFFGRSTTPAEKEAFESQYPQIRVYPFSHYGTRKSLFLGDFTASWQRGFPAVTDAIDRIGDRVALHDPVTGTEETLNNFFNQNYFEVRLKGVQTGIMASSPWKRFFANASASSRYYSLDMQRPYSNDLERRSSVSLRPSLTPMTVYYKTTAIPAYSQGFFLNGSHFASCVVDTDAEKRIFKSLRLFDPLRSINKVSKGDQYMGALKFGKLAGNHIEIYADMSRTKKHGVFCGAYMGKPVESDAPAEVAKTLFALNYVRQAGVKATVKIRNHRQIRANNAILAGSRLAGEYVKEA